jgi:hypothetical protein
VKNERQTSKIGDGSTGTRLNVRRRVAGVVNA